MHDDEIVDHYSFLGQFPVWFVTAEHATRLDPSTNARILWDKRWGAFTGVVTPAGKVGICMLSDDDLAERNARQFPGTIPVAIDNVEEAVDLLQGFWAGGIKYIALDPPEKIQQCNRVIPIKDVIESLRSAS